MWMVVEVSSRQAVLGTAVAVVILVEALRVAVQWAVEMQAVVETVAAVAEAGPMAVDAAAAAACSGVLAATAALVVATGSRTIPGGRHLLGRAPA